MTELIHCKFFLSLLLIVRSEVEFVNLTPFLLHWEDCYVSMIFYKPIDFFSRIPIVATTPLNDIYVNDAQCKPVDMPRGRRDSRYNFNINPIICTHVMKNYLSKGINCVGVMAVYPDAEKVEAADIYWYLNHYWSRAELQEYSFIVKNTKSEHHGQEHRLVLFPPFFPTAVFIQSIITHQTYVTRVEEINRSWPSTTSYRVPVKREWRAFMKLPIITAVIYEINSEKCFIALSVDGFPYFAVFSHGIENEEGKQRQSEGNSV